MKKIQVEFYDYTNGATSPIDTIDLQVFYIYRGKLKIVSRGVTLKNKF